MNQAQEDTYHLTQLPNDRSSGLSLGLVRTEILLHDILLNITVFGSLEVLVFFYGSQQ